MTDFKDSWKYLVYSMKQAVKRKPIERLDLGVDTLDLGEPCKWKDIKIGEVFGSDGCYNISYKKSKETAVLLSSDSYYMNVTHLGNEVMKNSGTLIDTTCYRLPKATQELFLPTEDN
jgi:hypothetical protein